MNILTSLDDPVIATHNLNAGNVEEMIELALPHSDLASHVYRTNTHQIQNSALTIDGLPHTIRSSYVYSICPLTVNQQWTTATVS